MNTTVEVTAASMNLAMTAKVVAKVTAVVKTLWRITFEVVTSTVRSALFLTSVLKNAPNSYLNEGGLTLSAA